MTSLRFHRYCCAFSWILPLILSTLVAQESSALWGEAGEKWNPQGRLPDFSFAGYHFGEDPLPSRTPAVLTNVRDFGAQGDDNQDDTAAFIRAIEAAGPGVVLIPAGRYIIRDILWIKKAGIVLRGEGPTRSILTFPRGLEEVLPNPSATTSGRPTSNYSWSGGFVWIKGNTRMEKLSAIQSENKRGEQTIVVEDVSRLSPGQRVMVEVLDDPQKTLLDFLYSGDPGDVQNIKKQVKAGMVSRILTIKGREVTLERALRFDLRAAWQPVLKSFEPSVTESGIEDLGFEFPLTPYGGHFTEIGYNAIAINQAADCWVRNVRILNSDSGLYLAGHFCTADGVVIESERAENRGCTGHHGITMGTDCLVQNFDLRTRFIHDISVDNFSAGNVIKKGRGINMTLDHHRKAPYENLFSDLDLGEGSVVWQSGGGQALGKHSAARGTFWGLRSQRDLPMPGEDFGPPSLNFVGLRIRNVPTPGPEGKWFETIPPEKLQPADLHAAQLEQRLRQKAKASQ